LRTLLISDIFPPRTGGSGRWFFELYRRLPRGSFLVAAGEHPHQRDFDLGQELRIVRLPLAMRAWGIASLDGLRGYSRSVGRLRRLVVHERIDMVHSARCLPEGIMALALKFWTGVPYACYVHGEDIGTANDSREHGWLADRVLRNASFLIANSRNTERMLIREWGQPAGRIRVQHPGVDTTRFVQADKDPSVRAVLEWGDRPVVLTAGRLQLRKGHDRMIRALRTVREATPGILYAIAGEGEERAALADLVGREGAGDHVQFLGEVDDDRLVQCYQQCDLFVLPNRQVGRDIEGFGMVLLEAQACGKPVIAGASGGTDETMRIPETGLVVSCDRPDDLAAAVVDLLTDPDRRARMGAAARAWMVERFDWEPLSRRAEALFRGAIPSHTRESVAT
jgi:phosphatidyl-myo-inositol dimannoside synthase